MRHRNIQLLSVVALIAVSFLVGAEIFDFHWFGLIGSGAFLIFALISASIVPSHRWLAVSLCGVIVLTAIIILYRVSTNEIIIDNKSGQQISDIRVCPTNRSYGFRIAGIPNGAITKFTFHDLFFDGKMNVAGGSLQDGSTLFSWGFIEGKTYRRRTRIIVATGGSIRLVQE